MHHRPVFTGEAVRLDLLLQFYMSEVVLRDDQKPARVLVDAVDDARADLAVDAGQTISAVVQERVDQSPVRVARRRVDDHAFRLVDDQQVIVLIDHTQRNILRLCPDGKRCRNSDLKDVAGLHLKGFAGCFSVDGDIAVRQEFLCSGTGQVLDGLRHQDVDALPLLLGGDNEACVLFRHVE